MFFFGLLQLSYSKPSLLNHMKGVTLIKSINTVLMPHRTLKVIVL